MVKGREAPADTQQVTSEMGRNIGKKGQQGCLYVELTRSSCGSQDGLGPRARDSASLWVSACGS